MLQIELIMGLAVHIPGDPHADATRAPSHHERRYAVAGMDNEWRGGETVLGWKGWI